MISLVKQPLLYVDDTVEQRYAMRRILETGGYTVLEAGTGKEALSLMSRRPQLVILDVKLPDMSGYDVCRQIKQSDPAIPVVQVSASFSDPNLRASGLSGGADAYIAQPVYPAELLALVRALLRTSEAEETLHFLAKIGPQISSALIFPETVRNIVRAMTPHFADRCYLYLSQTPGSNEAFWSEEVTDQELAASLVETASRQQSYRRNASILLAPLGSVTGGAIAFVLDGNRAYTENDLPLALELAHRAGLAMQNSILYTSEQTARAALIQSEKLAAAGRLSAAIAHELNNPLEAVTNLVYLIENSSDASETVRGYATAALSELSRLTHIARQSLGFYRELSNPAVFDLNKSVEETLELYINRFLSKSIGISTRFDQPVPINAIRGEIRQVISNLVVNALDAMEPGGRLTVETSIKEQQAVLRVSDTGSGLPAETLPHIFEAFYSTKQGTGTGLGLWVSQNIVQKHGGTIVARNDTDGGHGAIFEVHFPLSTTAAKQA